MRSSRWGTRRRTASSPQEDSKPSPFSLSATRPFAVQRYTVVTPDRLGFQKHAQVTTQDIARTRYGSTYRETTYTAKETGTDPNTSRVDTAINAGTMTSQDSALPSFRVSESGKLAVPDEGQPRNFYAQTATVNAANQSFRASGAVTRLMTEGHGVVVPTDPGNAESSETRTLKKVHAAEEVPTGVDGGVRLQLATVLPAMNCDAFISLVMGAANNASRVAVLQGNGGQESEIPAPSGAEPIRPIARHMTRKKPASREKMEGLLQGNAPPEQDLKQGEVAYERMSDTTRQGRSERLGINEFANPEVGEGFVIRSMESEAMQTHPQPVPNAAPLNSRRRKQLERSYLFALEQLEQAEANLQTDRSALPARIQRMMRSWGEHYAGVVAKDGPDVVTFENYNRRTEIGWEHERIFNNLFRDFEQFRNLVLHEVTSLYKAPSEETIRRLVHEARQASHLAQDYQNALDEAEASFATGLQQSQRTTDGNFFFQMYGPGEQSFHSAYKGIASNPMTLRLRETDGPVAAEAAGTVNNLGTFVGLLDTAITVQTVQGVTPTLRTRVQRGQGDHQRLQLALNQATNRGQYTRIDDEATQVKGQLRTNFRNDLIDGYITLTGERLAVRPGDLQGLSTLVTNYLANHQGTGFFGRPYAYLSGWRQKLLDFQTLLGSFDPSLYL